MYSRLTKPSTTTRSNYGVPRFLLVCLFVLAAGIDIRTRDLGLGGPASNPLEVMCLVALGFLMADSVVLNRTPLRIAQDSWLANPFLVMYGLWALLAAVTGLVKLGLSFFVFRNLFPAFMFFSLLVYGTRSAKACRILLIVFLIASLPNIALGISQYFFNRPYPMPLNVASALKMDIDGSFVRETVAGLFNHPNGLSVFLMPVFLTAFGLALTPGTPSLRARLCYLFMATISAIVLYLTRAKGAWAWMVFGVLILWLPASMLRLRGAWVGVVVAALSGIAALTLYSLWSGGSLKTMQTRVYLWESAWYALSHDLFVAVFGSGQADVWFASARLADLQYANAHNVFLNQAVYFGIPAMALYLAMFGYAIRNAQHAFYCSTQPQTKQSSRICLAVLPAIAGQYFFEPSAESSGLAVEVFLFMGLSAVCLKLARRESANT